MSAASTVNVAGDQLAAALAIGRKERLECTDGTWMCWGCGAEHEFHVSLHCEWCREQAAARKEERLRVERARSPEDWRWLGIERNMREDARLDRELAESLLAKARRLPSATPQRLSAVEEAFERRFERSNLKPGTYVRTYASATSEPEDWVSG